MTSNRKAALGIGTAPFSPQYGFRRPTGESPATAVLEEAIQAGVSYVDTAFSYGDSETYVGRLNRLIRAKGVRVCTKHAASTLAMQIEESLSRLRLNSVDTLLIHSASADELSDTGMLQSLKDIKAKKIAGRIGASTYGVMDARTVLESDWCDAVQVEYHIINPSVVRALAAAKRKDQEIIARSVLCRGLLTSRRNLILRRDDPMAERLDRLESLASEWEMSLAELAIRFALDTAGIDVVLVGVADRAELDVALSAARRLPLEPWQFNALESFACPEENWAHPERWPQKIQAGLPATP